MCIRDRCVIEAKELRKIGTYDDKVAARQVVHLPLPTPREAVSGG